jgi:hypothetical protein
MAAQSTLSGFTRVLIGDTGPGAPPATPTKVGDAFAAAALEVQSSTGGLLLPRLTNAQIAAVDAAVDVAFAPGTIAWNTDTNSMFSVNSSNAVPGIQYAAVTLLVADIAGMYAAPFEIIGAPGLGNLIIIDSVTLVNNFNTDNFTDGGPIIIQYDSTDAANPRISAIGTRDPAGAIANGYIAVEFLTATAAQSTITVGGATDGSVTAGNIIAAASSVNKGIYISNITGSFTALTALSTLTVRVFYRTIPV